MSLLLLHSSIQLSIPLGGAGMSRGLSWWLELGRSKDMSTEDALALQASTLELCYADIGPAPWGPRRPGETWVQVGRRVMDYLASTGTPPAKVYDGIIEVLTAVNNWLAPDADEVEEQVGNSAPSTGSGSSAVSTPPPGGVDEPTAGES